MIPIIQPIDSYEKDQEIFAFVREVVEHSFQVADWTGSQAKYPKLIVVKPNWVQESHEYNSDAWESIITHPTLVLAVVKALGERLSGKGHIVVCDAPHTYADFKKILGRGSLLEGLDNIRSQWPQLAIEVQDLRREVWVRKEQVVVERRENRHDPRGYVLFDLHEDSLFYGYPGEGRYYGADYDTRVVNSHHAGVTQEYLLAGTPLACDLFVNLPKLKTHKKTGLTCSLKNLVGINGDKNWLPHHTEGSPRTFGDEFWDEQFSHALERRLKRLGRQLALSVPVLGSFGFRKLRNVGKSVLGDSESVVRNGNWYGNDTCWRMALDLNRALLYGNMDGRCRNAGMTKNYLSIVDGIAGGEGNGPLCCDPVNSGVLVAGTNGAEVDAVACRLMGFDATEIPIVREAFTTHRWPIFTIALEHLQVEDRRAGSVVPLNQVVSAKPGGFRPHFGWVRLLGEKSRH